MSDRIAAIQVSDTGLKIMVGSIINGIFKSWYHKKVDAFVFESGTVNMQALKLKLSIAVNEVQSDLKRVINSWFLVYDIDSLKISKCKDMHIGDHHIKRTSISDLSFNVTENSHTNNNEVIVMTKPFQYRWTGKSKDIHSQERLPEPGTYLGNLHLDSLIYRASKIKVSQVKEMMNQCGLRIEKMIPSCFCYSYTLTSSIDKAHTIVADIGNESTKIMLYFQNYLLGYKTIPVGSYSMTNKINEKYKIGSLTKTVSIIKKHFSFIKNINPNAIIHEHINERKRERIVLTREILRAEGISFAKYLHRSIEHEADLLLEAQGTKEESPIFTTGGFTNAEGYEGFLAYHHRHMKHLDVSSVEGLDNGFASLLGMIELIAEDARHSGEVHHCISEAPFGFFNRMNSRLSRNAVQKLLKL